MPRNATGPTLARQWELLKLLPTHGRAKTASDLQAELEAAGHGAGVRTVQRDLDELARLFPIDCNMVSKPYGWRWRKGANLGIPGISLAEALSLGMLEDLLRQLSPPTFIEPLESRFGEAREKLRALPGNKVSRWGELVRYVPPGLTFLPPALDPEVLRTVQDALLAGRQLSASYTSAGAEAPKELVLHPLAMIQQGPRPYLLATTFDYDQRLYYALHRIGRAERLDKPARRPKGFSLDDFLANGGAQFGPDEVVALKARVSPELAAILSETPLSADQKISLKEGQAMLTATLKSSWQLEYWILSQGPAITVVAPAKLRKSIAKRLQQAAANYLPAEG